MVWRWQQRFADEGVEGLLRDKTRKPGKPPILADAVPLTCAAPPRLATHSHAVVCVFRRQPATDSDAFQPQRWLGKFEQPDRWISCLTAARLQRIRSEHDEANTTDAELGF